MKIDRQLRATLLNLVFMVATGQLKDLEALQLALTAILAEINDQLKQQ